MNNIGPCSIPKNYYKQDPIRAHGYSFDPKLGFKLPDGRDFVGEKDFITMQQQLNEIKASKKKVIINLGDSSTSGCDFNNYIENDPRVKKGLTIRPIFFNYKTYTDMLRDQIGDKFIVINAGVPGYTSLQGAKQLKLLLEIFKQHHVKISYVTSYFGNNDSAWSNGIEDKLWVGAADPISNYDKILKNDPKLDQIITRVSPEDYKINLKSILTQCRAYSIVPIIIEPVTSIYWKPAVKNKDVVIGSPAISIKPVIESFNEAVHLWAVATKQNEYSEMKQLLLEEAREKDFLCTRIKKNHLKALREVASIYNVPFVAITLDRTIHDKRYFPDTCHPINDANKFLADGIERVIMDFERGKNTSWVNVSTTSKSRNKLASKPPDPDTLMPLTQYPLY